MSTESSVVERARAAIRGLSPYQPGKPIEELERELGITGAVKLASNENPRGPGPGVQAAIDVARAELTRYPDSNGFALKQPAAQPDATPEQITLGNGSNDVLELLARVFVGPGDVGIVDEHCFVVYPLGIVTGGTPARAIEDFGHDLDAMAAAVDARARILYIANPNNPTGARVTLGEVERLLRRVPNDLVVVLDEAYCKYVDEDDHPDGVALRDASNLVVTRTFSKIRIAALRIGYSVLARDCRSAQSIAPAVQR